MEKQVLITEIQKFAVNDGPGFRTSVFLKGCPLQCAWCHNPETIGMNPDIYWKRRLCVQCGACMNVCPNEAILPPISPEESGLQAAAYRKIIRERCDGCMKCVDACLYGALSVAGRRMNVDDILDDVEKDRPFYDNSGGGLALSGGEPTFYADFTRSLLRAAKQRGIHTCLDTNGFCTWPVLCSITKYVDIVLFDLKHIDRLPHRQLTGVDNAMILENLVRLSGTGKEIWVRIPVVPGFNDAVDCHLRMAAFLSGLPGNIRRVDLLPYHNWCQDKYDWLGIEWPMAAVEALNPSQLETTADIYRESGFEATVGGSGFEAVG
ncbi:MAG: glycyl-radical enzyme activating protein [Desulfosalsimonadaceae bacterium]